jgi:putative holliday junction resolvase
MNECIKYLGIDWGEARIGLSLGDSETKIATPFKVVGSLKEVLKIIKEEEVDKIIIGEPVELNSARLNKDNPYNNFFSDLKKSVSIPIHNIDERYSSQAADSLAIDKKSNAPRDAVAAMLILQSYLDMKKIEI